MNTHDCPGGCGHQVNYARFACRACWFRLPGRLRQAIRSNHRRDSTARSIAMHNASEWYQAHPSTNGQGET